MTKLESAQLAIQNFHTILRNMGAMHGAVQNASSPEEQDEARTLLWQNCDLMDAAVVELQRCMTEATSETRGEIRRARFSAHVGLAGAK